MKPSLLKVLIEHRSVARRFPAGRCAAALLYVLGSPLAAAHVFVFEEYRAGSFPPYDGDGWIGEAYIIPEESAAHLISAEIHADGREPDFTFRTHWIDFPAGPEPDGLDAEFATVGDFLEGNVFDVSDPAQLDLPFDHLLLRFTGFLRVALEDDVSLDGSGALPVWVEMGSLGHDAYRTRVVDSVYRLPIILYGNNPFAHENAIVMATGLFPIQVTYFNKYEPDSDQGLERAGIELYSWHGGGLPWPGGENLVHPERGAATILPPEVIYQSQDVLPVIQGDYDGDFDVDLHDARWFQYCHTGRGDEVGGFTLELGCNKLDFDDDADVDTDDLAAFLDAVG